jgi:hypothetical protein
MPSEMDILAIEPFYGGERRAMLDTVIAHSRHRWTLLKLPARRMERRLATAAVWFAEVIAKRSPGNIDALFCSEVLNLSDLYRLVPWLDRKPAVVYFHSNQLPDPVVPAGDALDLVNLNTAMAATETWYNSLHHLKTFLARANALVQRHAELLTHNPMPSLTGKAQLMHPAVDLGRDDEPAGEPMPINPRRIVMESRGADVRLLGRALELLHEQDEGFELTVIGSSEGLPASAQPTEVSDRDEPAIAAAIAQAGVFVSTRTEAFADRHAVRALSRGTPAVLPNSGVYPELLPELLRSTYLYEPTPEDLARCLLNTWRQPPPGGAEQQLARILFQFDPDYACREMDDRFEELAMTKVAG